MGNRIDNDTKDVSGAPDQAATCVTLGEELPLIPDINDNFSKGRVAKYFPYQGYGFILNGRGRELYFNVKELDFVGEKGIAALSLNVPVGFDVSQTSHGLHVKRLKIY